MGFHAGPEMGESVCPLGRCPQHALLQRVPGSSQPLLLSRSTQLTSKPLASSLALRQIPPPTPTPTPTPTVWLSGS